MLAGDVHFTHGVARARSPRCRDRRHVLQLELRMSRWRLRRIAASVASRIRLPLFTREF